MLSLPVFSDRELVSARPAREVLDPLKPYGALVEQERSRNGRLDSVATIFLTNRECPFRCTMCDLWKYTLAETVPRGAIPTQIDLALAQLEPAQHLKLYNAGNFFDPQAIPPEDHEAIAQRVRDFQTVIIENHPRLIDDRCVRFRDQIQTRLEVAVGLETIHPELLQWLNKRMSVGDFDRAARFLAAHDIDLRVFLILGLPGLSRSESIEWTLQSLIHAFDAGASCCSIIPLRGGNGILDQVARAGLVEWPTLRDLESVLEQGIALSRGRVFVDLWDAQTLPGCPDCRDSTRIRLHQMNLTQVSLPPIDCPCRR